MHKPLNRTAVLLAVFTERFLLPLVYLYFALTELRQIEGILSGQIGVQTTVLIDSAHHLVMLLLCVFTSLLLWFGRPAAVPPEQFKFILVPLAASFFFLLYYTVPWFPAPLRTNLSPVGWQTSLLVVGLTCIVTGPLIALWGIWHLGRSFGIYVTVRKIVMTGPYRWVRHPMYLGWVCMYTGVVFANFSVAYLVLVAMHLSLLLYRARLEEGQLSAHSPEYRQYMQRTGFIFPWLHHPASRLEKSK